MNTPKTPPCAQWKIWKGIEVEGGASDLGKMTLFVRHIPDGVIDATHDFNFFKEKSKCERVWLCKEFIELCQWDLVRAVVRPFPEAVMEVRPEFLASIPADLVKRCKLAIKVSLVLKPGDIVCVGMPFNDESFVVGTGTRVTPEDYKKDIKII